MKNLKWAAAGMAMLAAGVICLKLHAQTVVLQDSSTGTSLVSAAPVPVEPIILNTADMATVKNLSDAQLAAFISVLDATPLISYGALPTMPPAHSIPCSTPSGRRCLRTSTGQRSGR